MEKKETPVKSGEFWQYLTLIVPRPQGVTWDDWYQKMSTALKKCPSLGHLDRLETDNFDSLEGLEKYSGGLHGDIVNAFAERRNHFLNQQEQATKTAEPDVAPETVKSKFQQDAEEMGADADAEKVPF